MTEEEFLRQVLKLARLCGWRSYHPRPGRTAAGWRTPVQGDGSGFPDVILLRGDRCLVAELKTDSRSPTPEQRAWLAAFNAAGIVAAVWRPRDWRHIERELAR
jgi:hypothetical protein